MMKATRLINRSSWVVLVFGCLLLGVASPAWSQVQLTINPVSTTQNPGVDFTVGVMADNGAGILSFAFNITYDNGILEYTGADFGTLTSDWTFLAPTVSPGSVQFASINSTPISGASGSLLVLGFRVRETATAGQFSPIRINSALLNSGGISNATTDGQVIVSSVAPSATVSLTPDQPTITNNSTASFRATFDKPINASTFGTNDILLGGTLNGTGVLLIINTSSTVFDIIVQFPTVGDGTVTLQLPITATITDTAGNAMVSASNVSPAVTVDRSVPRATVGRISPSENPTYQTSATFSIGGEGVFLYRYAIDGGTWSPEQPATGVLTLNNLPVGSHTLRVVAGDLAGNWQTFETATISSEWSILEFVPHAAVVVPFFFDMDAAATKSDTFSTFIAVANTTDEERLLHVYYRTSDGTDATPEENSITIGAHSTLAWRPVADDLPTEGVQGAAVPNATSPEAVNAVITVEGDPGELIGRVVTFRNGTSGSQSAYELPTIIANTPQKAFQLLEDGAAKAAPVDSDGDGALDESEKAYGTDPLDKASTPQQHQLIVPMFLDNVDPNNPSGPGTRAFIGVLNTTDHDIALAIEYFSTDGQDSTPEDNQFILGPGHSVSWRPAASDPPSEGPIGSTVPDAAEGSAVHLNKTGNVLISYFGQPGDVVGRVMALVNNEIKSQSAYLIPTNP